MKKNILFIAWVALFSLFASNSQAQSLKDLLNKDNISKVVNAITGTPEKIDMTGTWTYSGSAVEFESDNLLMKAGGGRQIVRDGKIELVAQQKIPDMARILYRGADRDVRVCVPEVRDDVCEVAFAEGDIAADADLCGGGDVGKVFFCLVKLCENRVCMLQQILPRFREIEPPVHPFKQLCLIVGLQFPDGAADSGLGHIQTLRGFCDTV